MAAEQTENPGYPPCEDIDWQASELRMFACSESDMYRDRLEIIKRALRKKRAGTSAKTVKLHMENDYWSWLDSAQRRYRRQINPRQRFVPAAHKIAAKGLAEDDFEEIALGNWDDLIPRNW